MTTADLSKSSIGYYIAGFGATVLLLTLFLLYQGVLTAAESKGILITLIIVSALLIGLGMYAVVPKESHDFVSDVGGVARDIVPRFARAQAPPTEVTPAQNQSAIVHPSAGPPVVVSPTGETQQITDADVAAATRPTAPAALPNDPELATGPALPFARSLEEPPPEPQSTPRPVKRAGAPKIGEATKQRQTLYPPDDA